MTGMMFEISRQRGTAHKIGQLNPMGRYGVAEGTFMNLILSNPNRSLRRTRLLPPTFNQIRGFHDKAGVLPLPHYSVSRQARRLQTAQRYAVRLHSNRPEPFIEIFAILLSSCLLVFVSSCLPLPTPRSLPCHLSRLLTLLSVRFR